MDGALNRALETLDHLLAQGTPPLVLLSMTTRHFRILIKARHGLHHRTDRSSLPSLLGVPPFVVDRYLAQARKRSPENLKNALRQACRLDHDLKSTGLTPRFLLERTLRDWSCPAA
jgi:DNA polymerase-3 subunit delta